MKKLFLALPLFLLSFGAFATNCMPAGHTGTYALETTMSRKSTIGNEHLDYGFNGSMQLAGTMQATFNGTDATGQNGIIGTGATWSITTNCKIAINNMTFYNVVAATGGGYVIIGNPIVTNVDFVADVANYTDDSVNKYGHEWVVRGERINMESTNQFTGTINTDYFGRFKMYKVLH